MCRLRKMLMLLSVHMTSVLFFCTGGKFCPDYGLLLELHALTPVAHSYALLWNGIGKLVLCKPWAHSYASLEL